MSAPREVAPIGARLDYQKVTSAQGVLTSVVEVVPASQDAGMLVIRGVPGMPMPRMVTAQIPILFGVAVYYCAPASSCLVTLNTMPGPIDGGRIAVPAQITSALMKGWARVFECEADAIESNSKSHADELGRVALAFVEAWDKGRKRVELVPPGSRVH